MRIWPWSTIKDLRFHVKALEYEREAMKRQLVEAQMEINAHNTLLDEKTKAHEKSQGHLKFLTTALAIREGFAKTVPILLLMLAFTGAAQPVLRQWFSTNQAPITYAPAATIDGTVFPQQALMHATDGNRETIGDGVTSGGIVYGVRYWQAATNVLTGGSRPGELAVSANGIATASANGPTLWMNAGSGVGSGLTSNGTNWLPIFDVKANDIFTADFSSPFVPFIHFEIGTNGNSDTGGTGGPRSFPNTSSITAGNGGSGTNNGTGGSGSDSGGFTMSGGNGGWATGTGSTGGNGGGGGSFAMQGGTGGNASFGFSAGNGGLVGNFVTSGGNGGNDTASGAGANGGAGGIITSKGGDAEVNSSGISVAGGKGGTVTTAGVGTNAGGSFTATGVFHKRPGGSVTTYASSYMPACLFTTTTTAGPSASSAETTLLGTTTFLAANSAQSQGAVIGSNIVDHAGRTLRFKLSGYLSTSGTPTLEIRLKIGGTAVIDTGAQSLAAITGNETWTFSGEVTCRTVGAAGTWIGQGYFMYFAGPGTAMSGFSTPNTGTTTLSTLIDESLDCTAQFGANNTLQCTSAIFEFVN